MGKYKNCAQETKIIIHINGVAENIFLLIYFQGLGK